MLEERNSEPYCSENHKTHRLFIICAWCETWVLTDLYTPEFNSPNDNVPFDAKFNENGKISGTVKCAAAMT